MPTAYAIVLTLNLVCTTFMLGLIWFVQIVHYPLLAHVGRSNFTDYETLHCRRTGWVVLLPMIIELVTALFLPILAPSESIQFLLVLAAGLVLVVWCTTAFQQKPAHRTLLQGYDETALANLVRSNWIRTVTWTARAAILVVVLLLGSVQEIKVVS